MGCKMWKPQNPDTKISQIHIPTLIHHSKEKDKYYGKLIIISGREGTFDYNFYYHNRIRKIKPFVKTTDL